MQIILFIDEDVFASAKNQNWLGILIRKVPFLDVPWGYFSIVRLDKNSKKYCNWRCYFMRYNRLQYLKLLLEKKFVFWAFFSARKYNPKTLFLSLPNISYCMYRYVLYNFNFIIVGTEIYFAPVKQEKNKGAIWITCDAP